MCSSDLVWIFNRTRHKIWFLVLVYGLSILYRNGLRYAAVINEQQSYIVLARQLPGFLSYFVSGMGLYFYFDQMKKYFNRLILPALLVFGLVFYFSIELLRPLAFSIMVIYAAYAFRRLINFGKYGDISYGIFIFYYPIIMLSCYLGLFHHFSLIPASLIVLVVILLSGFLSWHLIEKRFLKR